MYWISVSPTFAADEDFHYIATFVFALYNIFYLYNGEEKQTQYK